MVDKDDEIEFKNKEGKKYLKLNKKKEIKDKKDRKANERMEKKLIADRLEKAEKRVKKD